MDNNNNDGLLGRKKKKMIGTVLSKKSGKGIKINYNLLFFLSLLSTKDLLAKFHLD